MGIIKKNVGNVDVHGAAFYRYVVDDKPEKYVLATQDYNTGTNPLMGIGMEAALAFRPEFEAVQDSLTKDHENLLEKVSARDLSVAEKSQRKTYVDAALRHVIQEAAEQGKKCTKSGTLGGALSQAYSVSGRMLRIIQRACTARPVAATGEDEEGKGKAGEKMVGADGVTAIIMYAMKCAWQLTPPSPTSSLCSISLAVWERRLS